MLYKIGINKFSLKRKLEHGDPFYAEHQSSFIHRELELIDIANELYLGHAYGPWFTDNTRSKGNFICAQFVGVDIEKVGDAGLIDNIRQNEFVRMYAALIHTTFSHKESDPRCRIVFLLDSPIYEIAKYEAVQEFVNAQFPGHDKSCVEGSRTFLAPQHCDIALINRTLPLHDLRTHYRRWAATQPKPQEKPIYVPPITEPVEQAAKRLVDWAVDDATMQGRNNRAFRLGKQLQERGMTYEQAMPFIAYYQRRVENLKDDEFTLKEATFAAKSAFKH